MQFTFTIADSEDAQRLKDDLRRDPRIYTRTKKASGKSNIGKQFRLTYITVNGKAAVVSSPPASCSEIRARSLGVLLAYTAERWIVRPSLGFRSS
jgi:hypothetical protein